MAMGATVWRPYSMMPPGYRLPVRPTSAMDREFRVEGRFRRLGRVDTSQH